MNVDQNSPWYPYVKVQPAYFDLRNSVDLPKKICDYLIDPPIGQYTPVDDNARPRTRLWKYLYYDGARPLDNPLPNIGEKMSVLFDPEHPTDPPTDKGYRLIPQVYIKQAQEKAQTRIYCYMGRSVPGNDEARMSISVIFDIFTHYTYESNTRTDEYSRAFAIEQALIESLHGVNMDGIGTFYMSKLRHPDCGSNVVYDNLQNVGRELTIALEIATVADRELPAFENMPFFNQDGSLRIW